MAEPAYLEPIMSADEEENYSSASESSSDLEGEISGIASLIPSVEAGQVEQEGAGAAVDNLAPTEAQQPVHQAAEAPVPVATVRAMRGATIKKPATAVQPQMQQPAKAPAKTRARVPKKAAGKENLGQGEMVAAVEAATKKMASVAVKEKKTKTNTMTNAAAPTQKTRLASSASTASKTGQVAGPSSATKETVMTCYRCNITLKGPDAAKDMDKHLKECGLIVCVLCNNKFKSIKNLQIHQLKFHAEKKTG
ncbi:uncharacterized protein LOC132202530 [Neocloeon triangulifer]|uniref:uncharacterized protein LOC132202530 n=1 Tax=Neocloeon triangulifer TaxID=2078957 RepID=UPI00286FA91D|nr:uncharacterized protein LOC132202530 [Neocloeon triangulifer]